MNGRRAAALALSAMVALWSAPNVSGALDPSQPGIAPVLPRKCV